MKPETAKKSETPMRKKLYASPGLSKTMQAEADAAAVVTKRTLDEMHRYYVEVLLPQAEAADAAGELD